jgi:hypothetical protein
MGLHSLRISQEQWKQAEALVEYWKTHSLNLTPSKVLASILQRALDDKCLDLLGDTYNVK